MGGKNIIHTDKFLFFGVLIIAFFVLHQQAYAFGHPDVTAPSIIFKSPGEGQAINPDIENPSSPGFKVTYESKDTTLNDVGGNVTDCALYTKNGGDEWRGQGPVKCNEAFVTKNWCNAEGTNTCGVRIGAADGSRITQQERFFTIDYTPPYIEISSNRSDPTQKTDATFRFSASDAYRIGRVECALDNQPFGVCESPKQYKNIFPDGRHVFKVRAYDKAGNSAEKTLTWEVDSTPPTLIPNLSLNNPTYFSKTLNWLSPEKFSAVLNKIIPASQYDIRYSVAPITEANWNETTAIVRNEPNVPKAPGGAENMLAGPGNDRGEGFKNLRLGDISNILSANIKHYFAIKSRDQNWNWSRLSNIPSTWTRRDPCDYDADRLYSPRFPSTSSGQAGCGPRVCNPDLESCDLYDNPHTWRLPGDWPYDKPDEEWIKTFGATSDDLDQDGIGVAALRVGVNQVTKEEIAGYQKQTDTDWYDNPFTLEFLELSIKPTLSQLANTINDLDLDTFVSQDWKNSFAKDVATEPADKNINGCIYPGAAENTCFNCTAYDPDSATGRVPPGKTKPDTNKNRVACQLEAYYTDLPTGNYEIIQQGTIDKKRPVVTASANCRDGIDNDLDKGVDSSEDPRDSTRDVDCPTQFSRPTSNLPAGEKSVHAAAIFPDVGLVQCGRHADDYRTQIDESADCDICHFFYTIFNITNLTVSRLMPLVVALLIVAGGLMIMLSRGSVERYQRGRKTIIWAVLAYALTLLGWTLISIFFVLTGTTKWTGFMPERGDITALTETAISDSSKTWTENQWRGYPLEIQPPIGEPIVGKIESNTADTLSITESQPFIFTPDSEYKYHILNTGWWSFVCNLGEDAIADFSASPDSGIAPFGVDFTDLSIGKITSWSWDFGDGANSLEQSPKHAYTINGPHSVTLTVIGKDGNTGKKTKTIHYAPTADFSASKTHGGTPLAVQFENKSAGEVDRLSWDFDGDNREDSSDQDPTFIYTVPGPYRVKLTVSGPGGIDTESKLSYVFVYPRPIRPLADFSISKIPGTLTLTTTNSSLLSFLTRFSSDLNPLNPDDHFTGWKWDFGDGRGTSGVPNPTYFYETNTEPYTLILTAIGPGGERSTSTTVAFPPQANFSATPTSGALPASGPFTVRFLDNSTGTVSGWGWDFGDGGGSSSQNPTYDYQANGLYTVKLKATGPEGEDAKTIEKYIAVAPYANFEFSSVRLTDATPQPSGQSCISGDCTVGASGAVVTFSPTNTRCSGSCSAYWEFGDGGTKETNGVISVTHTYTTNEVYTVRLTVTGTGGSNTREKGAYINVSPYAEFAVKSAPGGEISEDKVTFLGKESGAVNFSNQSRVNIPRSGWLWEFGDGRTSSEREPAHTYSASDACYSPRLTANGPGGLDTEIKQKYVTFAPVAKIEPQISTIEENLGTITIGCGESPPPLTACVSQTFTNLSEPEISRSGQNWISAWSGGDGAPASPVRTFCGSGGANTVTLTVTNACDPTQSNSASATVNVILNREVIQEPCPPPPPPPEEPEDREETLENVYIFDIINEFRFQDIKNRIIEAFANLFNFVK